MTSSTNTNSFFESFMNHRYRYRQFVGLSYVVLVSVLGEPEQTLFAVGTVLIVLGELVRGWASGHVKKNAVLATDGPYSFVRHPLYVGNTLIMAGFALAASLWWSVPLMVFYMLFFYPHTISVEDNKLHSLFKEEWEKWSSERNALIPRLSLISKAQRGEWSFSQSLRQNGEPVIALFLLGCLYILYTNPF